MSNINQSCGHKCATTIVPSDDLTYINEHHNIESKEYVLIYNIYIILNNNINNIKSRLNNKCDNINNYIKWIQVKEYAENIYTKSNDIFTNVINRG